MAVRDLLPVPLDRPYERPRAGPGIWEAIKADTLSIVAFQVGVFGFMALHHLVIWKPPLAASTPEYRFLMQVGMVVGYFTAWPVNAWLIRTSVKEKM